MNLLVLATNLGHDLTPVILQLLPWRGFEPDRRPALAKRPLGFDVIPQDADLSLVALSLDLPQNDLAVPDLFPQQLIDQWLERIELAAPFLTLSTGRATTFEGAPDGPRML